MTGTTTPDPDLSPDDIVDLVARPDDAGIAASAGAARAAADRLGASGDAAALAVRLLAADAVRRQRGVDAAPLRTVVRRVGTELVVAVTDRGEPVQGALLSTLTLAELGVVTGADGGPERGGNTRLVRLALPTHMARFEGDDAPAGDPDVEIPLSDSEVSIRSLETSDAASLVRCLYRCYGWSYPGTDMYFPERVAASITAGRRIGEVAVDSDGEVVAHWGAKFVADGVVETGAALTDPRFRRRGLAATLGERLLARLPGLGVKGRLREPVLTHPATQLIALREGAHIVGLFLHAVTPINQVGITDGTTASRTSVSVMYSPLAELAATTVWVPRDFEPITRMVLEPTGWGRTIGEVRGTTDVPTSTETSTTFEADIGVGLVDVLRIGNDLVDVLDDLIVGFRRAAAQVVRVSLPATDVALASVGSGLAGLGLAFAAFLPDFGGNGDTLVLQWLAEPVTDDDTWDFASDHVRAVAAAIVDQSRASADIERNLRRRHARRQQRLAALPSADDDRRGGVSGRDADA